MLVNISKVIVKDRIRKDFGDISELAKDIQENGLINPPVVIPEKDGTFTLLAGERRLRALKSLGMTDIEVRPWAAISDEEKINIEISENEVRKDFSKSERIEYARRLERIESLKAKDRQGERNDIVEKSPQSYEGKTREIVAQKMGIGSSNTYQKEKAIVDNKNLLDPSDFADWDEGKLSTNKAFQKVKAELERQKGLLRELQSLPPKTVIKEVEPIDYNRIKNENASLHSANENLADKLKNSEAEKQRLLAEKEAPEKQRTEHIIKSALLFNAGIAHFLEEFGGYVWLTEYLDKMSEFDRKGFISGIKALDSWIYQMKINLKEDLNNE